jgi:hypothetical protein
VLLPVSADGRQGDIGVALPKVLFVFAFPLPGLVEYPTRFLLG